MFLRLAGALLAIAAGAGAIVVAVELVRSQPGPVGSGVAAVPTTTATATGPAIEGGKIATPTSPGFPAPPPGAVTFAREAGVYGLGLAVVPGGQSSLVRVSVLSPEGGGQGRLTVALEAGAATTALPACAAGCYQASVATSALHGRVTVTIGARGYAFELPPSLELPNGTSDVARATRVWTALKTLVWHERLAASPTEVLHTVYQAVAPHGLAYSISDGGQAIIIGETRWDRSSRSSAWVRSLQDPPVTQPRPYWVSWVDARVVSSSAAVLDVTFFDPFTPAWFDARIDRRTGHTLTLRMITTAHFMQHVYGPFDAPIRLRPPAT